MTNGSTLRLALAPLLLIGIGSNLIGAITVQCGSEDGRRGHQLEDIYTGSLSNKPFGFMVLLVEGSGDRGLICAGSLVSERHVLTAGHCAKAIQELIVDGIGVEAWIAPLNRQNFSGQVIQVSDIKRHPNFRSKPYFHNDIAVITLREPVKLDLNVFPVCIGHKEDFDGSPVKLVGFGNYDCYNDSSALRIAQGKALNFTNCRAKGHKGRLRTSHVCAILQDSRGRRAEQASGDSGGPLFIEHGGTFVQIGLVSYNFVVKGRKNSDGVATNPCPNFKIPGTYTRIGEFKSFIQSVAPQAIFCE